MIKVILIIIFTILYFFNYQICEYFYKEDVTNWYYLRDKIYEFMFLILIVSNWFKSTLVANTIIVFIALIVLSSIIDKVILNTFTLNDYDYFIVLPMAVSIAYLYYYKRNK